MKKRIAMIMLSMTVLASCTSTSALAYTEDNANSGETVVIGVDTETAENAEETAAEGEAAETNEIDAEAEETTVEEPVEGEEPVIDRSETVDPLMPDGNMTLVDDVSIGTKQFLTLTTRDGNFYYLIIDRDKDGNENVHFLNQVDERDLISLMDADEAKELEEQLAKQKEEVEAAQAALAVPTTEPEPTPEPAPEPEKRINIAGFEISQKLFVGLIGCLIVIVFCIVAFVKLGKKKKPEGNKVDPDDGYEADEYVLEEEEEEFEE